MFNSDDIGIGFLLPWPVGLVLLALLLMLWGWYEMLPEEKKVEICTKQAAKYNAESRFDEKLGCLVKLDDTHWQKIEKYEKSGIIETK